MSTILTCTTIILLITYRLIVSPRWTQAPASRRTNCRTAAVRRARLGQLLRYLPRLQALESLAYHPAEAFDPSTGTLTCTLTKLLLLIIQDRNECHHGSLHHSMVLRKDC